MSNMTDLWLSGHIRCVLSSSKYPKLVFGPGAGGAYDAPPDFLIGWGGRHPILISFPLDAFGVSISAAKLGAFDASVVRPPTQIPGYAYAYFPLVFLAPVRA